MENKKQCFVCKKLKKIDNFYKHPQMPDGTVNKCKECNKIQNKKNWYLKREDKRKYDLYRQRYSIQRIFLHRYAGIKLRCTPGKTKQKYFVTGMKYLLKKDFLDWCYQKNNYNKFINIYSNWVLSGFINKFSPSIDRIDNNKSYSKKNIQWLTKSENSRKHNN